LSEAGHKGEDTGEDMNIKGGDPGAVVDIILFVSEKAGVVVKGRIVDDEPEHEEGHDAEDEVDEEGAQNVQRGSHSGKIIN
jgi:hypothetical protein